MQTGKKKKTSIPLYLKILAGMMIGLVFGFIALFLKGERFINYWILPWGQLFIRLLQLIAVPLIFVSLIKGIMSMGSMKSFSRLGIKALVYYLTTTLFAVLLGISIGMLVKPGSLVDRTRLETIRGDYDMFVAEKAKAAEQTQDRGPLGFLNDIVPNNIVHAVSNNSSMLQVIFFAVFFAMAALSIPKGRTLTVMNFVDGLNDIIFRMVDYIISFAPIGVTSLMAGLIVSFGGELSIFVALGTYALCVVCAMFFLIIVFYPLLIRTLAKMPVRKFFKAVYPVQLFAFTTSSSAATLPVTMEVTEKKLDVSKETSSFVLPIGATINMDGASCYQAISVLFIAQVLGIDLSMMQIIIIIGMTVLSSIGTPAIPSGSFVILTMVLTSVGIPPEGLALIIGIDRPLDMLRTVVNITGDVSCAIVVD